ncbi:MAG: divalent metal cation transporter, partial [Rhodospirillales bacterium]|nr:divalent metal cation transporter [Rhodospirillales bacterium]
MRRDRDTNAVAPRPAKRGVRTRGRGPSVLAHRIAVHRTPVRRRGLLSRLGPGLITGASDDDPSGIATYSQSGAQFGFAMCWVMLFTFPLMAAIQEISARIGRVTGLGIAGNLRIHYPAWLLRVIVALL